MLKGIDPTTIGQVTDLKKQIDKGDGKLTSLSDPKSIPSSFRSRHSDEEEGDEEQAEGVIPAIAIGREMANSL